MRKERKNKILPLRLLQKIQAASNGSVLQAGRLARHWCTVHINPIKTWGQNLFLLLAWKGITGFDFGGS